MRIPPRLMLCSVPFSYPCPHDLPNLCARTAVGRKSLESREPEAKCTALQQNDRHKPAQIKDPIKFIQIIMILALGLPGASPGASPGA